MAVDIEKVDLRRPDPNYKPDPALRGDVIEDDDTTEDTDDEPVEKIAEKSKPDDKKDEKKDDKKVVGEEEEEEEEEDPEEEEEPEEDPEEEEDEPAAKGGKKTLKDRFFEANRAKKQALEKLEKLEKENDTLRATQTKAENREFEKSQERIESLYEEIEKARATGDYKESAKLQKELDNLRGRMTRAETLMLSRRAAIQEQQVQVYNTALAQIEAVFPHLSEGHEDFDQELLVSLDETIRGYEALGEPLPDALRKAARRLLRYDPFGRGDSAWLDGPPEKKADKKEADKAPAKKTTDIKKNVDAAKRQPPDSKESTTDIQTKLDVKKIKPEEFSRLPEEVRRRLRGDTLTRE